MPSARAGRTAHPPPQRFPLERLLRDHADLGDPDRVACVGLARWLRCAPIPPRCPLPDAERRTRALVRAVWAHARRTRERWGVRLVDPPPLPQPLAAEEKAAAATTAPDLPFLLRASIALRWPADEGAVADWYGAVWLALCEASQGAAEPRWRLHSLRLLHRFVVRAMRRTGVPNQWPPPWVGLPAALDTRDALCTALREHPPREQRWLVPALNLFLCGGRLSLPDDHHHHRTAWADWEPLAPAPRSAEPTAAAVFGRRQRARFTDDEVARLREAAARSPDPLDEAMLLTFLHTGLRSGAVCRLRVRDLDWAGLVGRALEKNGDVRVFALDAALAAALRRHLTAAGATATADEAASSTLYVFPHPRGPRTRQRTHHHNARWLRALCTAAGLNPRADHVFVHAMRRVSGLAPGPRLGTTPLASDAHRGSRQLTDMLIGLRVLGLPTHTRVFFCVSKAPVQTGCFLCSQSWSLRRRSTLNGDYRASVVQMD